ncbi:MAG: hypothetical protein WDM84_06585 [Bauldia sp.]
MAPSYAVAALADRATFSDAIAAGTFDEAGFWATKAVSLAADWAALPVLLAALAGFIGIRAGYPAFITVRNWATVLMTLPFAAIALVQVSASARTCSSSPRWRRSPSRCASAT